MRYAFKMFGVTLMVLGMWGGVAKAGPYALHQGASDPATEGFSYQALFGPASTGPVINDMGYNAWNITADSVNTQAYYVLSFTSDQDTALATQGFTMTLLARVPSGPMNPTGGNFYPSIDDTADFGAGRRFDLALGLNSNGDTVAMLPTAYMGGTNYFTSGPSYTLTGSGSSYHLFQLVYSATTQTADLYVDGVDRISGYAGQTQFFDSGAAQFGSDNGGQGNTNLFEVQVGAAVPEPSTLMLAVPAIVIGLGCAWRRRRKPTVALS